MKPADQDLWQDFRKRLGEATERSAARREQVPAEHLDHPDQARAHPTVTSIAEQWAAAVDPQRGWEGIAIELVEALARGEFGEAYRLEGGPADPYELYFNRFADDLPVQGREAVLDIAGQVRLPSRELRRWCDRPGFLEWAGGRGLGWPTFLDDVPDAPASAARGFQGRPSMRPAIESEMRRRASEGILSSTLMGECRHLAEWARDHGPEGIQPPTRKTISNSLRGIYWALKRPK